MDDMCPMCGSKEHPPWEWAKPYLEFMEGKNKNDLAQNASNRVQAVQPIIDELRLIRGVLEQIRDQGSIREALKDSRPMTDWERKASAEFFWSQF